MTNQNRALAALALASVLLAGCTAASGSDGPSPPPAGPPSPPATAEPSHAGGHGHASPTPGTSKAKGPSDAALMVCGKQPMEALTSILDLDAGPHTINRWADSTFTCTYHLPEGDLDISVKEAASQASALKYFHAMQALAKDAKPLEGLANLGFPAYETEDGSAVFQKDSFVLHVDATGLPATLRPDSISRNALAYQMSTTILACWIEHP